MASVLLRLALLLLLAPALAGAGSPHLVPGLAYPPDAVPAVADPVTDSHLRSGVLTVEAPSPLRVAVLSDLHGNLSLARTAVAAINAAKPDLVVVLGDLADTLFEPELDGILDALSGLHAPLMPVMGNHERMRGGYPEYLRRFGPPTYALDAGDTRLVVLDGSRTTIPEGALGFLDRSLADAAGKAARVVLLHVPPYDPRPEEQHCLAPSASRRLTEVASRHRASLVLSGHVHTVSDRIIGGVPYRTLGAAGGRVYDLPSCGGRRSWLLLTLGQGPPKVEERPLHPTPHALQVWSGDESMVAVYRRSREAAAPGSDEFRRLSGRFQVLKEKYARYERILAGELSRAPDKDAWLAEARRALAHVPAEHRVFLAERLAALAVPSNLWDSRCTVGGTSATAPRDGAP